MTNILFTLTAFGSFLLLKMDASVSSVQKTAIHFILGSGVILLVRPKPKLDLRLREFVSALIFSVAWGSTFSVNFYKQWSVSSKVSQIASALHISAPALVGAVTIVLWFLTSILFTWLIGRALLQIRRICTPNYVLHVAIMALICVYLAQQMIQLHIFDMDFVNFLMEMLLVSAMILLIYGLSGNQRASLIIGSLPVMILSTVNVYVYQFRGRLFEPADIFSAKTALNVARSYRLWPIPGRIVAGWATWAGLLVAIFFLHPAEKHTMRIWKRTALAICCIAALIGVYSYSSGLPTAHWMWGNAEDNGFLLDYLTKVKDVKVAEPEGYNEAEIAQLAEEYASVSAGKADATPHIIVIMSESFSDLSVLGDLATNQEVTPFISNLRENAITGYVVSSVYGGNTANSEFEFLTGNSMAWMSPNVSPYQSYISKPSYSMVSYLKTTYNYQCIAMHPYLASGWDRPDTYAYFGFDECHFIDDFPQEQYVRLYISDRELYDSIITTYENRQEQPLFLFSVSMQNHGDYCYKGDDFEPTISLDGFQEEFPEAEQYLSLLHETDQATEELIAYFAEAEEPVVILFFGDHQPALTEAFYRQLGFGGTGSLEELQKQHLVPFFIWANYELEEQYVEYTSLNYLSSYVYQAAGLSLPLYNRFLTEMESVIPVISSNGIYSREAGAFLSLGDASESEQVWLRQYEQLQYNDLFASNLNEAFFPTLE